MSGVLNPHRHGEIKVRSTFRALLPLVVLVTLASGIAAAAGGCGSGQKAICGNAVTDGRPAPDAESEALSGGGRISVTELRGSVVVVNFWASWCGPCRVETPILVAAAKDHEREGVRFLGVDLRDSRAPAAAFEQEFSVPYRSVFDKDAAIAARWEVPAPPATFVIDAQGNISSRYLGAVERATLDCMIDFARGAPR